MKIFILLISFLAANSSFAFTILVCNNPATGAAIYLTENDGQPPAYFLNSNLTSNLKGQLGTEVLDTGTGQISETDNSFSFSSGSLKLATSGSGPSGSTYKLTYGTATFDFNSGECRAR